jgi:gliding motility-associated-like protein
MVKDSIFSPSHLYAYPGTYAVTLIVTNDCSTAWKTHTLIVNPLPWDLGDSLMSLADLQDSLCPGNPAIVNLFNPQNHVSYQMMNSQTMQVFGSAVMADNDTLLQITALLPDLPDTVVIIATNVITGCSRVLDTVLIFMNFNVLNPDLGPDVMLCPGQSTVLSAGTGFESFTWSNGDTTSSISVNQAGTYWLSTTDSHGCYASDTVQLGIFSMVSPNLVNDTLLCSGISLVLDAGTGFVDYTWNTSAHTSSIIVTSTGIYSLTVTDVNGCMAVDSSIVTFMPTLVVSIFPPEVSICVDSSVILKASGATFYSWSPASGLSSVSGSIVTAFPTTTTTYKVSGSAPGACPDDTTITVKVSDLPVSLLPDSSQLCYGNSLELDPGICDLCTYLWSSGATSPSLTITKPGNYWVIIKNDGCQLKDFIRVEECSEIWIPNAFTPNGDDENDVFLPKGINIEEFHMLIFNRWGEQLFESYELENGWDGIYQGENCPIGVYVYLIEYKAMGNGNDQSKEKRQGMVTLVR